MFVTMLSSVAAKSDIAPASSPDASVRSLMISDWKVCKYDKLSMIGYDMLRPTNHAIPATAIAAIVTGEYRMPRMRRGDNAYTAHIGSAKNRAAL